MKQRARKFQVWDIKYGIMYSEGICIYGDGTFDVQRTDHNGRAIETAESESGELVLREFTGPQDKNGKDIYEEDVVKDDMGRIMKAGYHNLRPCWIAISATNFHHADFFDWSKWDNEIDGYSNTVSVEVIGNIYEDPELLPTNTTEG